VLTTHDEDVSGTHRQLEARRWRD